MEETAVLLRTEGAVAHLTLNRPQALNALNAAVLSALHGALDQIEAQPQLRTVVLAGAGDKAFAAGADIGALAALDVTTAGDFIGPGNRLLARMAAMTDKIFIAAIRGYAMGGGLELALGCDLRVATEGSRFGLPECTLGVIPGLGGTQRLPRLVGSAVALELLATGGQLDSTRALQVGLVNAVVPSADLEGHCLSLAQRIGRTSPSAVAACKRLVYQGAGLSLADSIALESLTFTQCFATADQKEGMAAFLEKRSPDFVNRPK